MFINGLSHAHFFSGGGCCLECGYPAQARNWGGYKNGHGLVLLARGIDGEVADAALWERIALPSILILALVPTTAVNLRLRPSRTNCSLTESDRGTSTMRWMDNMY